MGSSLGMGFEGESPGSRLQQLIQSPQLTIFHHLSVSFPPTKKPPRAPEPPQNQGPNHTPPPHCSPLPAHGSASPGQFFLYNDTFQEKSSS